MMFSLADFRTDRVSFVLFALASVLCVVPVWLVTFPPMADLPQHAAQVSLWFNVHDASFRFKELFETRLFSPYLLAYVLVAVLTPLFGVLAACKLVISVSIAAIPWATRSLLKATESDTWWAWLTFPVIYGFCYQWGFVSYLVAMPIGIGFLAVAWSHGPTSSLKSGLLLSALLLALFFSHLLVMGLFGAIAAIVWLIRAPRVMAFARTAWPLLVPVPIALIWLVQTSGHAASQVPTAWDLSWWSSLDAYYVYLAAWSTPDNPGWGRINGLFPRLFGRHPDAITTLFGLSLMLFPIVARSAVRFELSRWVPLVIIVAVLLLVPSRVHGVALVFQRNTFFLIPFFLLIFAPPAESLRPAFRGLRTLAPVFALAWIAWTAHLALEFGRDVDGLEAVIDQMQPERRALAFMIERDDRFSIAPVMINQVAWYSALKRGVTDPSFAGTQIQPVIYRSEFAPTASVLNFEWAPKQFNWNFHRGAMYDYYVVRAPSNPGMMLFRQASCVITLVANHGHWWLFQRDPACTG